MHSFNVCMVPQSRELIQIKKEKKIALPVLIYGLIWAIETMH